MNVQFESRITCPACGFARQETMPAASCQYFWECPACQTIVRPKPGDCCVYCSYGSQPCPSVQRGRAESTGADAPLFELQLVYRQDFSRITEIEDRDRKYLGSGEGIAIGPIINGRVEWDLFETQGETRCDARMVGRIVTPDGSVVRFDTVGVFAREHEASPTWRLTARSQLESSNVDLSRLAPSGLDWVGTFDAASYRHRYLAFATK